MLTKHLNFQVLALSVIASDILINKDVDENFITEDKYMYPRLKLGVRMDYCLSMEDNTLREETKVMFVQHLPQILKICQWPQCLPQVAN
jgi:hypothetical protein